MFCFRVKRRLYDFIEGNLKQEVAKRIRLHLQSCLGCTRSYNQLRQLLNLASQKKPPELSSQFWMSFDQELREKLAKERVSSREIKLQPTYLPRISLRPAFALATAVILLIAISLYLFGGLPTKERIIALSDERLVNDIEVLEELTDEFITLEDQDFLIDELILLEDLV
jgi:hypothetical protein